MNVTYFPILLIIAGGLLYQFGQKSLPQSLNAYFVIIVAYLAGIALCLLCQWLYPAQGTLTDVFKKANWAVYGIGAGAVLVEVGFLLAYRLGWQISVTSMLVNMVISLVLVPVGLLVYQEKLSGWNALGIAFYFAGLLLISKK
jgi:drug/metabolite transporter (DMT)-like permease